ncbi:MAG TPA: 6-bladed beta-propeller [Planctomycetota bacterium]|nr:6-bladed beta-propeller [Planctomycetota bacterium]
MPFFQRTCTWTALARHGVTGAALACASLGLAALALQEPRPPRLGSGAHVYDWVPAWGQLPEGSSYGNTHGAIAVDSKGRIYVNTDSEKAVIAFEPDGTFVKAWGSELAGGLHGMAIARDGEREVLWLAHTGRHEVIQTTLDGEILRTIPCPLASGHYERAEQYLPTSVAVAPDGSIFVADGYGRSWVHQFDAAGEYVRSIGGPGEEPGKFRTPHGISIDARGGTPKLLVADRENHRLQWFDLEGRFLVASTVELRRPCIAYAQGDDLVVADLGGRVTILDRENRLVCHLGDNPDPAKRAQNGVPREQWKDGEFLSPHCARWDAAGDLYVVDWNAFGRVNKLARVR